MVRWLEENGYDVSYITNIDLDTRMAAFCSIIKLSFRSGITNIGPCQCVRAFRPL